MYKLFRVTLLFVCLSHQLFADENISFGKVQLGENRMRLVPKFFEIKIEKIQDISIKAFLVKKSFQWVRVRDVLLIPRGRISLYILGHESQFSVDYLDRSLHFQNKKAYAHSSFYVSLFNDQKINIYKKGKLAARISIKANNIAKKYKTHLIDYSCSRNDVKFKNLGGEFLSAGCRTQRIGVFGKEKPMLEVLWSSSNWRLLDGTKPPYIAVFLDNRPVKVKVKNHKNEIREIEIHAKVPKRLHRINTAIGFGPYAFDTSYQSDLEDSDTREEKSEATAPALMLYYNYKINEEVSLRGFDAFVFKESKFNNFGAYFANDVGSAFDKKLTITTLIGMQHLYFSFDEDTKEISEHIFPQGIEAVYRNAFGIKNYVIGGGFFLSPSENIDYQNIWIRWGKGFFWEVNYIYWGKEEFSAKMWGLSIGLPLKGFF